MASPEVPKTRQRPPADPSSEEASPLVRFFDHFFEGLWSWAAVMILVGLTPALAIWPLAHLDKIEFIVDNLLDITLRRQLLGMMFVSLVLVSGAYGFAWWLLRRRGSNLSFGEVAKRINRYTFILIPAPLLTALMHPSIESRHEFITLLLIVILTICAGVLFYRLLELRPGGPAHREVLRRRWLPVAVLLFIYLFYALYLSFLAILDHVTLGTHIYDLGIYDSLLWHTSHGDFLGCNYCKGGRHYTSHFDPILVLLVPLYKVWPRAEMLLAFQAFWLGTGVFPLYLMAKRRLGNPWFGVMLAAIYVMYPALHGVNMFDFHSLALAVPSFLWAIYFVDVGAKWRYWMIFGVMLLTREDMSLLLCFVALYAIMKRRPVTGLLTIVLALSYLVFVKTVIMPDAGLLMQKDKDVSSFIYYYEQMIPYPEEGMKGLIISFLTNPAFVIKLLFHDQKIFYFLALLVPLLFLPVFGGKKRIIMLYGLVFIGLATRKYVYSLHFQYSTVLFPALLASMPDAIDRVSKSRIPAVLGLRARLLTWALMWTSVFATTLTSYKFGVLWPNDSFRAGWNRLDRTFDEEDRERYGVLREMVSTIPPEASVCSPSGLGPHVSNREKATNWPWHNDADYLLLRVEGMKKKHRRRLDRMLRRGEYRSVMKGMGLELFERVPEEEQAQARKQEAEARREERSAKRRKGKGKGDGKTRGKDAETGDDEALELQPLDVPRRPSRFDDASADDAEEDDGEDASGDGDEESEAERGARLRNGRNDAPENAEENDTGEP